MEKWCPIMRIVFSANMDRNLFLRVVCCGMLWERSRSSSDRCSNCQDTIDVWPSLARRRISGVADLCLKRFAAERSKTINRFLKENRHATYFQSIASICCYARERTTNSSLNMSTWRLLKTENYSNDRPGGRSSFVWHINRAIYK